MDDIASFARRIAVLSDNAEKYSAYRESILNRLKDSKDSGVLREKQDGLLRQYNDYILHLINEIRKDVVAISSSIENETKASSIPSNLLVQKRLEAPSRSNVKIKKSIDIDSDAYERFVKSKRKKKKDILVLKDYSLYEQSEYGRVSNYYMGNLSQRLIKKHPEFFSSLFKAISSSNFQILANTYVSIIMFTSLIMFFPAFVLALLLIKGFLIIKILAAVIIGALFSIMTFAVLYSYPSMIISSRRRYMEADLPFVVVHMAAVAGSGAHPIAMFNLILSSGEYKGLDSEIKKIINYVNLFGYNLTTSLRLVAAATPLKDFKEVLAGIVMTIETGGNLKEYLNIKAQESMERYKAKRQRYVQNLATFSDIYIGVSLVAPMLLFMTLSIINSPILGGTIGGFNAGTLGIIGTYIAIPLVNAVFLVVLSTITPK